LVWNKAIKIIFLSSLFITQSNLYIKGKTLLLKIFQSYCDGQFYKWRKLEYPKKTIDMPQVTDKLYLVFLSSPLRKYITQLQWIQCCCQHKAKRKFIINMHNTFMQITVYHSGALPAFNWFRIARCLVLCVLCCRSFSFGHCNVCPPNYDFWFPLWYLQAFLNLVI
jgi:hypothetical protein